MVGMEAVIGIGENAPKLVGDGEDKPFVGVILKGMGDGAIPICAGEGDGINEGEAIGIGEIIGNGRGDEAEIGGVGEVAATGGDGLD